MLQKSNRNIRVKSQMVLLCCFLATPLFSQVGLEDFVEKIHYRLIGPTRQGGRVVAFTVSKQNPYTFYAAAGPGGVFKTINNGNTFFPVFDNENIASVGDVTVAPSDDKIVWIGSGEANLRNSTYYGNGVYKSVDGAKTWQHMGLEESHHIGRVLIHPENPDIVYVAAQGHYYSENPERGIYKTVDGGKTWTKSLDIKIDGRQIGATEVRMDPNHPDVLYGITYDRLRTPWSFKTRGVGSAIYKSTDAGNSWVKLENGLPAGPLGKIGIDIYDKNPKVLYTTIDVEQPSGSSVHEIYRSDDAGASWHRVSKEGESVGGRSNYYGQIIIDPNNDYHLYALGTIMRESFDGGKTWGQYIKYGGDNHALWIDPNNSNHMLLGYDYGMAISHDAGKNWYHPDELPLGQFYAVGVDMEYPYNVYGGTQDFGSWKGPSTKKGRFPIRFEDWEHVNGGDGFYNLVDTEDSRWLYSGSQFGHITRVNQKTGERKTIMGDESEKLRFNWNTPMLISPHNSKTLYIGAQKLLRSMDRGDNWDSISPDLAGFDETKKGFGPFAYGTLTSVDESPVQQGVLWAGTDNGHVYLTTDGGKNWVNLDKKIRKNPGYWVTRVTASSHDAGTAYVTYSGLRRDDFRPFIYKTTDFGKTWTSIAKGLPNESVNVIKEDRKNSDLLFIGTDKAVYCSLDGGVNWLKMKNNMPTVAIHDLVIHPRENDLVVGTHGRSIYIADISVLQELSVKLLEEDIHLFEIEPKVQWRMNSQPAVSAQNFSGENEPPGVVINYYLKETPKDEVKISIYKGNELAYETTGTKELGLNQVLWGMTKQSLRSEEEKKEWEQFQQMIAEEDEFFDYYDTVEIFPRPEEEVDKYGRSMRTRVHPKPGLTVKEYKYSRIAPGEYNVVLSVGNQTKSTKVILLEDKWAK